MPQSRLIPSNRPLLSMLVFCVVVIAGLLMIVERAGLPTLWVERMAYAVGATTLVMAALAGSTTQEKTFFGTQTLVSALVGGCVLGVVVLGALSVIAHPKTPTEWLAVMLGSVAGVVSLHVVLRLRPKAKIPGGNTLLKVNSSPIANAPTGTKRMIVRGILLSTLGFVLATLALVDVLSLLRGRPELSNWSSAGVVLFFPVLALLAGGLRASVTLVTALALLALVGLAAMISTGFVTLGDLPLPGLSEKGILADIQESRTRWGLTSPLFFEQWPSVSQIFYGDALFSFVMSAAVAAALAYSMVPAIQVRRRSLTLVTLIILCVVPIAVVAVGGYAIEAAGLQFIGAAIVRPPAGLLEAARLGLVSVCGSFPTTAEAMRVACGVLPRDTAVFGWDQLKISQDFLRNGLPVAQGYPTVMNAVGYCVSIALALAALTIGLWMIGKGLGQNILARHQHAPGLASFRLALTRLAVCLAAAGLFVINTFDVILSHNTAAVLVIILAVGLLVTEAIIQKSKQR